MNIAFKKQARKWPFRPLWISYSYLYDVKDYVICDLVKKNDFEDKLSDVRIIPGWKYGH